MQESGTSRRQAPEPRSDSAAMVELAGATGARLGLGVDDVADLTLAATLHDIGEGVIPDSILEKPGPLDPEEWAIVKRHTLVGERILAADASLAGIGPIVRSSHERVDGRGYPDGLRGEQIPLQSRIIAVADAFDAMVGSRPYRQPMSTRAALTELERCAGTQFDARVVKAFVAVVRERRLVAGSA